MACVMNGRILLTGVSKTVDVISSLCDDVYKSSFDVNCKQQPMHWCSRFPLSLSECLLTIYLMPYNHK